MKRVNILLIWAVLSLVLAGSVCAGTAGAIGESAAQPQTAQAPAASPAALAEIALAEILAPVDSALLVCSPPPQCWTDRDCDRICGKGLGTCVKVNSCYRECACAAVAF